MAALARMASERLSLAGLNLAASRFESVIERTAALAAIRTAPRHARQVQGASFTTQHVRAAKG
jgi:hypothetical protein